MFFCEIECSAFCIDFGHNYIVAFDRDTDTTVYTSKLPYDPVRDPENDKPTPG
jgi:hypothetical protein